MSSENDKRKGKLNIEKSENTDIVKEDTKKNKPVVKDVSDNSYGNNREKQKQIGGGFAYFGGLFFEAKANFGVSDAISISPSLDYYLGSALDNMIIVGADGHYNFFINDDFTLYPLFGFSYIRATTSSYYYGSVSASFLAVNIGGGMNYAISDKIKIYSELKYVRGVALTAGVMFSL